MSPSRLLAILNCLSEIQSTSPLRFEARMLESDQVREALQKYRIIAIEKVTKFGELHLEVEKINFRVALMLFLLDENEEAFTVFEDVYSKLKVISGLEDEFTLTTRGYMANILRRTGKVALPTYQEIHDIVSRKWPFKKITLTTKINMALELSDEGKFCESLAIWDEVIRIHGQINSDEYKIWMVMGRKAYVLYKQGKYSEATSILRYLHQQHVAAYGEDDPRTWSFLSYLGVLLADQGEYDQAEGIFKVVLCNNKVKTNEESIMRNQLYLALVLKKQGKLDESLALLKDQYNNSKNKSPQSKFVYTMKLSAKILDQQGKYEEALRLYRKILIIEKPGSPDLDVTNDNISRIMGQWGKSNRTGPSPNELYEIESIKCLEIFAVREKYVEFYP